LISIRPAFYTIELPLYKGVYTTLMGGYGGAQGKVELRGRFIPLMGGRSVLDWEAGLP
jgi:hypothetical protein